MECVHISFQSAVFIHEIHVLTSHKKKIRVNRNAVLPKCEFQDFYDSDPR